MALQNITTQCGPDAEPVILEDAEVGATLPPFDAVILQEDLGRGQFIAGYTLQYCTKAGGARLCTTHEDWHTLQGKPILGVTVGRKVIERGFGLVDNATALAFSCKSAAVNATHAYLRAFATHRIQAPVGWPGCCRPMPPPPAHWSCTLFGCTCAAMGNYYGLGPPPNGLGGWGCAVNMPAAQAWWVHTMNCTVADYATMPVHPGCGWL